MKEKKAKKPFYKKWWVWLLAAIIIFAFLPEAESPTENNKPVKVEKKEKVEKVEKVKTAPVSWEEKVKEVAASEGSETEKFDTIMIFASEYKPKEDEIIEFEQSIIKEYKDGKYIADLSNHEYMLSNIFKARVVEMHSNEGEPLKDFAFDFGQNSKYTYRGVDSIDSSSVKSNESQMNDALANME